MMFKKEKHNCTLPDFEDSLTDFLKKAILGKCRESLLITTKNPLCFKYFRSEIAVKKEKKRQLTESSPFIIHPLSKFRIRYTEYLIFLYSFNLAMKPIEAMCLFKNENLFEYQDYVILIINGLNYIDILINFLTGYIIPKTNNIELRFKCIVRQNLKSILCFSDIVSSVPPFDRWFLPKWAQIIINMLILFKLFRLPSLLLCIHRTADYFRFNRKGILFLLLCILVNGALIHWMACITIIFERLGNDYWYCESESYSYEVDQETIPFLNQFEQALFKTSSEMLDVRVDLSFPDKFTFTKTDDYVTAMFNFLIGRILKVSTWVVLAMTMMSYRSMEIKFIEVLNQLDSYMVQKGFPINLKKKIKSYYQFKYQNKFFKEEFVHQLLSNKLQKEVNMHVCKSFISKVSFLAKMTPDQINHLVPRFVPEIFLPKETIVRSGYETENMYFISSGTVALYTRTGKEVARETHEELASAPLMANLRISVILIKTGYRSYWTLLGKVYGVKKRLCREIKIFFVFLVRTDTPGTTLVCHIQEGGYFNAVGLILKTCINVCSVVSIEMTEVYRLSRKDTEKYLFKCRPAYKSILRQSAMKLKIVKALEDEYKREQFEIKFKGYDQNITDVSYVREQSSPTSSIDYEPSGAPKEINSKYLNMDGWVGLPRTLCLRDQDNDDDPESPTV